MPIEVVQGDITRLDVDAIVNAANSSLAGGGGVDGAIHRAAGGELAKAATRFAPCPPGQAVLTPGFRLRARFVIHTVGPIWTGGGEGEPEVLRAAYENSFRIARGEPAIRSIAFPSISTGAYMFPKKLAAEIALEVMRRHVDYFDRVIACVYDDETRGLYERLLARGGGGVG
jgi:O-acetyl-ADP-ribose deacetylase (regulator of RNase III)